MNIFLFGCNYNTLHLTRFLQRLNLKVGLVTISPDVARKNEVAGYEDLTKYPSLFNSIYVAKKYSLKDEDITGIKKLENPKLGLCIGWQRLIPREILDIFKFGIFGMHGSARDLPFGKGRSPMNWALIEGRSLFHTNLFKYQVGVDNGPVLDSQTFSINQNDTAETLHYKNALAMCNLIKNNFENLISGSVETIAQSLVEGESYYPKRAPADGIIDWRDDIYNIERLIRAVTKPFACAFGILDGKKIFIERAAVFYTDVESHPFKKSKFGEILEVFPSNKFLVRCAGGVLIVHEYEGTLPKVGCVFKISENPYKRFKRNDYGFFDV